MRFSLKVDDEIELALPVTKESIDAAFEVIKDNFDHLKEWMNWANDGFNYGSLESFYKSSMQSFAANGNTFALQMIYHGEMVGGIGLHAIDRVARSAESGYCLAKNHCGKGIVTRSESALCDYAFDEMGLNRIAIKCALGNAKSRAVSERLGFTQEGIEREAAWLHTRFIDHVVYSMLAAEWSALKNKETLN